mmetsp:Transcript_13619/g.22731  ORF Transcript_13619/g.22731 Transcript_13619/m.22731 type:complete len:198 (+) Transcript_13619:120-713(+)
MAISNWRITSAFPVQIGFDIDGEAANDGEWSGLALSSDGSIVAIGARRNDGGGDNSGHVRVFELSGNSWIQKGGDIDGLASGDDAGYDLDISDDGVILAVSSLYYDGPNGADSGHVRIFEWDGSTWVQKGSDLVGLAAGDGFGGGVGLSGDGTIVAVAADMSDSSGQVRVFQWDGSTWIQMGSNIDGWWLGRSYPEH